jgi:hypothetical protein
MLDDQRFPGAAPPDGARLVGLLGVADGADTGLTS